MTTVTTKWRIPPYAWGLLALPIVAETLSNGLRAYGLGAELKRFAVPVPFADGLELSLSGGALVLAAVAVSLSQAHAAWTTFAPARPMRQRIVTGAATLLLLAISITAMASNILDAGRSRSAGEGKGAGDWDRAKAAYDRAATELRGLDAVRSTSEVQAAMGAARINPAVFAATRQCTDTVLLTGPVNNAACKPILDLRVEMAAAIRKAELAPRVETLRQQLAETERPATASEAEATINTVWAWIMGTGVVFLATFGSILFARVETVTAPAATQALTFERPLTDPEIEDLKNALKEKGGKVHIQQELIAEHGGPLPISKGELCKRIEKAVQIGAVRREWNGRTNTISLH